MTNRLNGNVESAFKWSTVGQEVHTLVVSLLPYDAVNWPTVDVDIDIDVAYVQFKQDWSLTPATTPLGLTTLMYIGAKTLVASGALAASMLYVY